MHHESDGQYGHLEVVKWLHKNRPEGCTSKAMNLASRYGWFEVVMYLHLKSGEKFTPNILENAALNGQTDILEFHRRPEELVRDAATDDHFCIVQLLELKYGCAYFDEYNISDIAHTGHFAMPEWLMVAKGDVDLEDIGSLFFNINSLLNAQFAHCHSSKSQEVTPT